MRIAVLPAQTPGALAVILAAFISLRYSDLLGEFSSSKNMKNPATATIPTALAV